MEQSILDVIFIEIAKFIEIPMEHEINSHYKKQQIDPLNKLNNQNLLLQFITDQQTLRYDWEE